MNNTLPPLPLIDDRLFIDNSGWIEGLSTCHRFLQYRSLNLRVSAGEKPSLNFGSAIHLALEHRYRKYGHSEVGESFFEEASVIFTKFFNEHPVPMDDWRNLNYAMDIIRRYIKRYPIEEFNLLAGPDGKPLVELPFAIEICRIKIDGREIIVMYSGRIDLPTAIERDIYVTDHKTSGQMGTQFWDEMRMTSQQRGYCWAFQQATGQAVHGYVINGIRTKDIPEYVRSGKDMNRAGKRYTAESFWNETFQRERVRVAPHELEEWKRNTIDIIEEFAWHYNRGYMPMKTKWCAVYGKCPYYDVCKLHSEDRGVFLASGLFTDNIWSPLNKPTQSKQ